MRAFATWLGMQVPQRFDAPTITDQVVRVMTEQQTSLVILDEVHNLRTTRTVGAEAASQLKVFTERLDAAFVYCGIDLLTSDMFTGDIGKQIRARTKMCALEPYSVGSEKDRDDWLDLVLGTGCTVSPEVSTYRGENVTGKNLTGRNDGEGAQVLTLKPAHPTPSHADAQEVLDAYCAAMGESGAPVVKAKALLAPIRAALSAGYSAPLVLIGLGMWEAEGFRSPRQIEEWVEKAARQGGEPQTPTNASDLLGEGRERYRRYLARRELATPSKAEVRRTRSAAELQAFAKRAP